MSYMVEAVQQQHGEGLVFHVYFVDPRNDIHYLDTTWRTHEEASERCSYLNGGMDPEFKAEILRCVRAITSAYIRQTSPDGVAGFFEEVPRVARCVHGKLSTEDCEKCARCDFPVMLENGDSSGNCVLPYGHEGEHRSASMTHMSGFE